MSYSGFSIVRKKTSPDRKKVKEKMITSDDTKKKACKKAKLFQEIYDMGYTDGMGW